MEKCIRLGTLLERPRTDGACGVRKKVIIWPIFMSAFGLIKRDQITRTVVHKISRPTVLITAIRWFGEQSYAGRSTSIYAPQKNMRLKKTELRRLSPAPAESSFRLRF